MLNGPIREVLPHIWNILHLRQVMSILIHLFHLSDIRLLFLLVPIEGTSLTVLQDLKIQLHGVILHQLLFLRFFYASQRVLMNLISFDNLDPIVLLLLLNINVTLVDWYERG